MKQFNTELICEWYPPSKYVFKPIYNFLRRKCGLNQYVSLVLTYDVSAGLHAAPFLLKDMYAEASILGGAIAVFGLWHAGAKYIENKKRYRNKTIDSFVESLYPEIIDE